MKDTFIMRKENRVSIDRMTDEDAGILLKAIMAHADGEKVECESLPNSVQILLPLIANQIDRADAAYQETVERRKEAGRKGGLAKQSNAKQSQAKLNNSKHSVPVPVPDSVPVSPIGDKRKSSSGSKEKFIPPFNSEAFQEAWDDFKRHRRRLKKPMTEYTEELTMKKLMKLSDGNEAKSIRILRQSIAEGWIGIFELKKEAKEEPKKERRVDYDAVLIDHYIRTNGGKDEVREHQNRG